MNIPITNFVLVLYSKTSSALNTRRVSSVNMSLFSIFFVYLVKVTLDDSYQSGPHVANFSEKFHMDLTFEVCEVPLSFHSVDIL
jgi:ATP/ADP translocase